MNLKKLAEQNYFRFCQFEGHDFIASEYALYRLLKIFRRFKIKSVLEVGLGIGSISDTILKFRVDPDFNYVGTEANHFCRNALKANVEFYDKIELFESIDDLPSLYKFDFIIIDGQDETLRELPGICNKRSIVFIEGDRSPQAQLVLSLFPKARQVQLISIQRNKEYSTGSSKFFVGGGRLIFTNPNLFMTLYWFKEKVSTYLKRHLRNYL
jgi:hypothetical protein